MRPGSNPFHSNNLDGFVESVIRWLSCGLSKSIGSCKSTAVTESNLGRVQSGAPFLFSLPSDGLQWAIPMALRSAPGPTPPSA